MQLIVAIGFNQLQAIGYNSLQPWAATVAVIALYSCSCFTAIDCYIQLQLFAVIAAAFALICCHSCSYLLLQLHCLLKVQLFAVIGCYSCSYSQQLALQLQVFVAIGCHSCSYSQQLAAITATLQLLSAKGLAICRYQLLWLQLYTATGCHSCSCLQPLAQAICCYSGCKQLEAIVTKCCSYSSKQLQM